jgi:hypothetical protein
MGFNMMRFVSGLAVAVSLALASGSRAEFTGLQLEFQTSFTSQGVQRNVYRLYAKFSQPTDQLVLWGANETFPTLIRTCNGTGGSGTSFFNHAGGSNTAPTQANIDQTANVRWDTFATIGVNVADQGVPSDQTTLTPGFPTFINTNQWSSTSAAVFVIPDSAQARADFAGDGDAPLRVLMAQLTCRSTESVGGKIGSLLWRDAAGQNHNEYEQRWNSLASFGVCCIGSACVNTTPGDCATVHQGMFIGCAFCADCALPCPADVTNNDVVDIDDLLEVINGWGLRFGPADINADKIVDIDDLLAVINAWGPCP